jgi:glycogen operon protein
MDLVSYNEKHNEANLDNNNDGENNNRSWNCGIEGPTDDPDINNLRKRQVRNFLTTLFLSQGVPMLLAGDESGRTQMGNNNAYCQDNEISWLNWENRDEHLFKFTSGLIHFRLAHPAFCRNKWFRYKQIKGAGLTDIEWFLPEGTPMSHEHWNKTLAKSLGIFLSGDEMNIKNEHGEKIVDDTFFMMFNSDEHSVRFTIPGQSWSKSWFRILDTNDGFMDPDSIKYPIMAGESIEVKGRSVVLLINKKKARK